MLVFVVIVVAAGCLAGGLLAGQVALIWGALALSLAGAALLAFVLVRGRPQGSDGVGGIPADLPETSAEQAAVKGEKPAAAAEHPSAEAENPVAEPVKPPAVDEVAPAADGDLAASVSAVAQDEESVDAPGEDAAESVAEAGQIPIGDGDRIVRVVPGRRRFHAEDCRLLAGRAAEEISLGEAREEGFSACTACIPRVEGPTSSVPVGSPAP
ncbi:MAG TPA: hypothetical protein VK735_34200 [Pseudonocardia sp.]|uniref:hypothetical protein n=1 Tax=Pseudonocardia sp. TaxID=60912 RepID=UPI002BDC6D4C|nr:hypothetical protein [Pseudonocardia sp.]HTF52526.1 hypothetical protein [Pseudonocardia sp.]